MQHWTSLHLFVIWMSSVEKMSTSSAHLKKFLGAPGWLSWLSVRLLISAQVMISRSVSSSPASDSVLTAQSLEPALDSVSPSLSTPPPLALCLSLSLSQERIHVKKIFLSLFLREREREHKQRRGRKRGRERIPSRLSTVRAEPKAGLDPMNWMVRSWPGAEIKSRMLNRLSQPGAPNHVLKSLLIWWYCMLFFFLIFF